MPHPAPIALIAIPLISAATGYVTNYIAVRMLFRPREEQRILGLRVQGLIPRRRRQLAESVGETVERHLISHQDIRAALDDPAVREHIRGLLDERLSRLLSEKLPTLHPMAGMLLTGGVVAKVKATLMVEIMGALPSVTEDLMDVLEENLDFRRLVVEKIEEFDLERLERIVQRIASRELRAIEVLGGALGFVIGLVTDALLFLF